MKIYFDEIEIITHSSDEMIDITSRVSTVVRASKISNGDVSIFCLHTTAAVTINENADPDVIHDILLTLSEVFPRSRKGYRHAEGNSDAHVKSSVVGCSQQVLVRDGGLVLGTWQGIYFCEFDGPRNRRLVLEVRGE